MAAVTQRELTDTNVIGIDLEAVRMHSERRNTMSRSKNDSSTAMLEFVTPKHLRKHDITIKRGDSKEKVLCIDPMMDAFRNTVWKKCNRMSIDKRAGIQIQCGGGVALGYGAEDQFGTTQQNALRVASLSAETETGYVIATIVAMDSGARFGVAIRGHIRWSTGRSEFQLPDARDSGRRIYGAERCLEARSLPARYYSSCPAYEMFREEPIELWRFVPGDWLLSCLDGYREIC